MTIRLTMQWLLHQDIYNFSQIILFHRFCECFKIKVQIFRRTMWLETISSFGSQHRYSLLSMHGTLIEMGCAVLPSLLPPLCLFFAILIHLKSRHVSKQKTMKRAKIPTTQTKTLQQLIGKKNCVQDLVCFLFSLGRAVDCVEHMKVSWWTSFVIAHNFGNVILPHFIFLRLGMELRTVRTLGKYSTTWATSPSPFHTLG